VSLNWHNRLCGAAYFDFPPTFPPSLRAPRVTGRSLYRSVSCASSKFAIAPAAILCILLPCHLVAAAQEVGFRDLRKQVFTTKSQLNALREFKDPDCPTGPAEIVADAVTTAIRDLELEVIEPSPTKLRIDVTRSITLRLRNTLTRNAKIPWQMEPKPFNPLATSNDPWAVGHPENTDRG
jgi:hypothetical protein